MTAFINTYVENSCALRGARRVKQVMAHPSNPPIMVEYFHQCLYSVGEGYLVVSVNFSFLASLQRIHNSFLT